MKVTFGSILLNEAEYLLASLTQHYQFCDEWILVEGADKLYPGASPDGLSVDDSAEIIRSFPDPDRKLRFIQHGFAVNKQALRNRYMEHVQDGVLVVIDIDEFMTHADMQSSLDTLRSWDKDGALCLPHAHFWKTDAQVITGGYYDIPHDRMYRITKCCRYGKDHNHPERADGTLVSRNHYVRMLRQYQQATPGPGVWHLGPCWLHYGFCKDPDNIRDKNAYYVARGEAISRPQTTASRAAWFAERLPENHVILSWAGKRPEYFTAKGDVWPVVT